MGHPRDGGTHRLLELGRCSQQRSTRVRSCSLAGTHHALLALEENIPITDPAFYSSEDLCPDSLIDHVFRGAAQSDEQIPLLKDRIAIMRQVGSVLCNVGRGFLRPHTST